MFFSRSILSKIYISSTGFLILSLIGILVLISDSRLDAFKQYHTDIGNESIKGIENQISFYIEEKRRTVRLFVSDHTDLIKALAADSENERLHVELESHISEHFPDHFAFSLADKNGTPLFEDFDGLISELCLSDLKQFSAKNSDYHPYIHPNTEGYHFDIMARYGDNDDEGVLLISFLADILGDILKSIQVGGHEVMLIFPEKNDLIEVVVDGARNHMIRDDYRLSREEISKIRMRRNIVGTRWQAIDMYHHELYSNFRDKLAIESAIIFFFFFCISILSIVGIRKEEQKKELLEKQKQELMGVVSHEFRSPVAVIKSALDLISVGDAGSINNDVKKYIDMASCSTSRLMFLVDDFLDLQKLESGKLEFDMQKESLKTILDTSIRNNELYAGKFGVKYILEEPLDDGVVICDKNRIEQVLTNILSNAAKYGEKNDRIQVKLVKGEGCYCVSVTDHGNGIPENERARVFEKFSMFHTTQNDLELKSSGLGLSIAKAIIEEHGGSIGFDTEVNKGSTFWFKLSIAA